jgi:hypothetical protein
MSYGEFRAILYFKTQEDYQSANSFYRDGLELPAVYNWDDGPDDRGVKYQAGNGMVEVIRRDPPCPLGPASIMLETTDVDRLYEKVIAKKLPIIEHIVNRPYGIRVFRLFDPNKNEVILFSYLKKD